jgi:hypothetical protein
MPPVTSPYPGRLQDQDEKGSLAAIWQEFAAQEHITERP